MGPMPCHWGSCARPTASLGPAPGHQVPHRSHVSYTSFGESQITTCQEGFRCVSRTGRFGTDHTKQVMPDKARTAQAENKDEAAPDGGGEPGKEGEGGEKKEGAVPGKPKEPEVEEYEFNCPVDEKWVQDQFQSGPQVTECRE